MRCRCLLRSLLLAALAAPVPAAEFHVDPLTGSPGGDGSAGSPWRTLEEVIADGLIRTRDWESLPYQAGLALVEVNPEGPVGPGDTLWLRSGHHGELVLRGAYNEAAITIAAAPGHQPTLRRIEILAAQNWIVRGVSVSPSHAPPLGSAADIVEVEDSGYFGPAWDVTIEDCDVFTVDDASAWAASDWVSTAWSGVGVGADRVTLRGNRLRNVRFGISVGGEDARIEENVIDGFSADGLRGLGDGGLFAYNVVKNAYVGSPLDGNHDDGFQSWSVGPGGVGTGTVRDVVLRGNLFINNEDPGHPLHATLQGIGCFDGLFENWTVENNVVITDHWHGISFYGMIDSRIVNNTVIDLNGVTPGPPWILVTDHKNGTQSANVVVRNNLTTDLSWSGTNVVSDHNLEYILGEAATHFVAPPFDLRLLPNSVAVDGGSPTLAPSLDIVGVPRPQGTGVDIGAYEGFVIFADGFESGDASAWREP